MASGRVHELWGSLLATGGGLSLLLLGQGEAAPAFAAGAALSTFLLSPDVDHPGSRPTRRWGPLRWILTPYQLLFPHRSASHAYLTGPLSRMAYAGGLAALLLHLLGANPLEAAKALRAPQGLAFLAGWLLGDWLHLLLDGVSPRRLLR
ncbi:hypothetical protein HRbin39_01108 [bacterium HR39]|nr:hypothetical protein HRbin39_01108 [bacterium HR39]